MPEFSKINAVFEGGGVKGSGLIGAITVTEELGYTFEHVAGTSAGAIVAALIAAGYTGLELKQIIDKLDYSKFKDPGLLGSIPLIGTKLNLLFRKGLYGGYYFENWLRELLEKKGVTTFADLVLPGHDSDQSCRYKLQVVASDLTRGRILILPNDIGYYGIDPDDLEIVTAVRMSMSIPFFFKPVLVYDKNNVLYHVVDGGILSNYPVWLFDQDQHEKIPTVGYKLVEPEEGKPREISSVFSLLGALFSTMSEAHDARYVEESDFQRTVPIHTLGVQTTQFDISKEQKQALFDSGATAAKKFFSEIPVSSLMR